MKVFSCKGFLKDLCVSVDSFKDPIEYTSAKNREILRFFKYVASQIPEVRSNFTGREFELNSSEAKHIFGEVLAQNMYVAMNRINLSMTCKFFGNS